MNLTSIKAVAHPPADPIFDRIIGKSEPIRWLKAFIAKIAPLDSTILITGPSGSGKELVADLIHSRSGRGQYPFPKINCASIPENLLESELFGFEKGAFTGASIQRPGKFELADKGTILLDEIGEIPLSLQAKLLRVTEYKQVEKLGACKPIKVDARIIAATNRDLSELVRERKFREDLFYRLNVVRIHVPALRERMEDIPLLVRHFLSKINTRFGTRLEDISSEAMSILLSYDWPGNIRELANVLERAAIYSEGSALEAPDIRMALNPSINEPTVKAKDSEVSEGESKRNNLIPLGVALDHFEKSMIIDALSRTSGIQKAAAEILGLSSKNLWKKIQKHSISLRFG